MRPVVLIMAIIFLSACQGTITGKAVQPIQEKTDEQIVCSLTYMLKSNELSDIPMTCYDKEDSVIKIDIENFNRDVKAILVSIDGEHNTTINSSEKSTFIIKGEIAYEKAQKIRVHPVVELDGRLRVCNNNVLEMELEDC